MLKVYLVRTSSYKEEMLSYLSEDELIKANRFKKEEDKKRFTLGRVLLKEVLKENNINDYLLLYNDFGKPYLKDNQVFFNLSHTGDFVVCALSNNEVGIDIEKIRPKNDLVIKKCFTESETTYALDDSTFTKVWTLKESYIKYLGTGLSKNLSTFETIQDGFISSIDGIIFTSMKIEDYHLSICHKPVKHFNIIHKTIF